VVGFCEHGNEPSGSIKQDIFDKLSDYQFFIEYPAPWSKYVSSALINYYLWSTSFILFCLLSAVLWIGTQKKRREHYLHFYIKLILLHHAYFMLSIINNLMELL